MLEQIRKSVFVLFAGVILSGSADELKECRGNGALKYQVGKSYTYNYGVFMTGHIDFDRQSRDKFHNPGIHVNGSAILATISECEFVLTLKDTAMSSRPSKQDGTEKESSKIPLDDSSIKFSMNAGKIQEIMFAESDPSWAVNLKKTVLFMLQNPGFVENPEEIESSVFGNCVTEYSKTENHYMKTTKMRKCGQGEGTDFIFHGVPYEVPFVNNKQIFGFLRPVGKIQCSQTLQEGILSEVTCGEKSSRTSPIEAGMTITSVLKLHDTSDSTLNQDEIAKLVTPSSVLYNYTKESKSQTKEMEDAAKSKLDILLKLIEPDDFSNKASNYIEMKKLIAQISDLEQFVVSDSMNDPILNKTFYDAVAEVATDEAIRVLAKAAQQGELDATTLINFYLNIAFATNPGVKALTALTEVIESSEIMKPGDSGVDASAVTMVQHLLLGASGLAHQYCTRTNLQCQDVPEYQKLVNAIATGAKRDQEEGILMGALHSLGNLDALTPEAVQAVKDILLPDSTTQSWLSIQAMDAFRRDPCQPMLKESVRKILSDSANSDEVRIHAYLAMSRCYLSEDSAVIQQVFGEKESAVGPFIASHVRNMQDSISPSKADIKNVMMGITIPDDVKRVHNQTRASRFLEYSHFDTLKNLGFSGEAAVIFIPGQTQPQFVSVNVTGDIMGRSFNFLEVGLSRRFMIQTQVYYDDSEPADWSGFFDTITAKDTYYRVFGTTIGLGLEDLGNAVNIFTENTGEGYIFDMIQPQTYLDNEFTFPSIAGLPISLDINAVHFDSIEIEMKGSSNISDMFETIFKSEQWDLLEFQMNAKGACLFSTKASISVGSHTPLHTGYMLDGALNQVQDFQLGFSTKNDGSKFEMDVNVNFPKNIISFKDASLDVYSFEEVQGEFRKLRNEGDKPIVGASLASQPRDCSNFGGVIGLRACSSSRNSGSFPMLWSYSLEKENQEMKGFDIKFSSENTEFGPSSELTLTTPDATTHRLLKFSMESDQGNMLMPGYWESKELVVRAELKDQKYVGRILQNLTQSETVKSYLPKDIEFIVDYSNTESNAPQEIFRLKTEQVKDDALNAKVTFSGPLEDLGMFELNTEKTFTENSDGRTLALTNTLEWNGKGNNHIAGDLIYSENGTSQGRKSSALAKLTHNKRQYELQHLSEVRNTFAEIEEDGFTYNRVVDQTITHNVIFTPHPNDKYEADFQYGTNFEAEMAKRNVTFNVTAPSHRHENSLVLKVDGDLDRKFNASLVIEGKKETMLTATIKSDSEQGVYEINGVVPNEGHFLSNFSISDNGQHQHIHVDMNFTRSKLEIIGDVDVTDDGNEFREKTDVVVKDEMHKKTVRSETRTVIDRSKRSLDYTQTTTGDGPEFPMSVKVSGKVAPDYWNGRSYANMHVEQGGDMVVTASANHTLSSSENKYLKSNLAMDLHSSKNKMPFTFTWDLRADKVTDHEDQYEMEYHVTSDKRFTGEIMAPFDIFIQKDIIYHKTKGQEEYEVLCNSNVTEKGVLKSQSEGKMTWTSPSGDWKTGTVRAEGNIKEGNFKNEFQGQLDFEGDVEQRQVQKVTFSADRTDLTTQVKENVLNGEINKSTHFHSFADFEMMENGTIKIDNSKTYKWTQLVRMHDKEFTVYKDIEEVVDGQTVGDKKFLFDVSAKITEQNHQTKLVIKTHHNLSPQCPTSHLNFTLSK